MKNIIERIKVAWYALTKKEFYFAAIDQRSSINSGAVCYTITNDTLENHQFYSAIIETLQKLINEL